MSEEVLPVLVDQKVDEILKKIVDEIVYLDERELDVYIKAESVPLNTRLKDQTRTIEKLQDALQHLPSIMTTLVESTMRLNKCLGNDT